MSQLLTPQEIARSTESVESLTVSTHEIDQSFYAHIAGGYWAWSRLFDRDPQARITQHPDLVLAELQHSRETAQRPGCLLVCSQGSEAVAAAILVPKSLGKLPLVGRPQGYWLVGNQFLGREDAVAQQLLMQAIGEVMRSKGAGFLLVEDVAESSPVRAVLENNAAGLSYFLPAPQQARHTIELPATADAYWGKFTSKTRGTYRRKVKQFGACRLERISEIEQVSEFLIRANEISQHSWQTDLLGLRVKNNDAELQFFVALATQQALRAYLLWKDDVAVSFCIGTQHNGVFSYEEVAYDRRFADSSPGHVMVIQMLDDLLAHQPPRVFDFGFGDAEYKRQFGTSVTHSANVWLLPPGLKSKWLMGCWNGRSWLARSARAALAMTGLRQRIRQLTRRGIK